MSRFYFLDLANLFLNAVDFLVRFITLEFDCARRQYGALFICALITSRPLLVLLLDLVDNGLVLEAGTLRCLDELRIPVLVCEEQQDIQSHGCCALILLCSARCPPLTHC